MGVCTEKRPVMHWPQSARFLGPPRECSPTIPGTINTLGRNNNYMLHRPCASCPDNCEHNTKIFDQSPIFNESCRNYDTRDQTLFDEQFCSETSSVISNSCLQLKSEPQIPSSPESSSDLPSNPDDCAGCGKLIQDRFYFLAVDKRWHAGCLQCCICCQSLDGETSCFSRDGNIYCKTDYYRIFGARRCSRCMTAISSSELVMRARHLVFHIKCFFCTICNSPLTTGDQFGMRDSSVYCRLHYENSIDSQTSAASMSISCQYTAHQFKSSSSGPPSPHETISGGEVSKGGSCSGFFGAPPGLQQPPRQKGRPRKRKPKDIEAMTANLDLNLDYLDLGYGRGGPGGHLSNSRAKRMRTSFKHHQLRTMKSYFAINHNPDAKDLKQLSQKTGLPKRVLQVWFQNARAKWRRMMMKQEGKSGGGSEKGDSLDLDSYVSHSSPFMLGGPPSPHSIE